MYTRLGFNQLISEYTRYTTSDLLISGAVGKVGVSLATNAVFVRQTDPFVYSTLGLSFRMPGNMIVMPQVQYAYTGNELMSARCEIGKYIFGRGYFNVAYEENLRSNIRQFQVGLRWDFLSGNLVFGLDGQP